MVRRSQRGELQRQPFLDQHVASLDGGGHHVVVVAAQLGRIGIWRRRRFWRRRRRGWRWRIITQENDDAASVVSRDRRPFVARFSVHRTRTAERIAAVS